MKHLFAIILCLSTYTGWSQITITKNDMPAANDTVRYSTSNTRLNFDTTGAGITWDYSALVANGQGIDSFLSAFAINPAYVVYFGLNDYGTHSTNLANITALGLSNIYSFYKKTSAYLEVNGFGAEYQSIPIPGQYSKPDIIYQFPLSYGRMDTTPYDLTITIPGLGSLHQVGTRYNNVDGYGTVITPYGTFPCIRLRAYTTEVDSFTITLLGQTIPFPQSSLTYQWLTNGQIIPVLEVTGTDQRGTFIVNSEKFRDGVRFIPPRFAIHVDFSADKTVCTTADTVTITNRTRPTVQGSTYLYTITPSTYTFVDGTDSGVASPKVNFNAPGLYTVSLHVASPAGGSVPAVGDTTKVEYIDVSFPAGIENINAASDLQLYPNPVSDVLTVRTGQMISTATLISSTGRKVMSKEVGAKSLSIDVRSYTEGIYLLDIQTAAGHEVRKVIIQ
jgi:hypothetical protein